MRPIRTLLAAAIVLAPLGGVAHAWSCYGSQKVGAVCYQYNSAGVPTVNPTGSSYDDCIWIGTRCVPVSVPIPTYTPGSGSILDVTCGGDSLECTVIHVP
jgi:hypothetical protein